MSNSSVPTRYRLAADLEISRLVTGLWQVADQERGGTLLDPQIASSSLLDYARAGFDTFDMADHYGSAELITGRMFERVAAGETSVAARPVAFTKWCPVPGPMTAAVVREGVQRSLKRLGVESIDLLQFHWWSFEHPAYLDALGELSILRDQGLIRHLGVTNFDTEHLRVVVKNGIPIKTNQVSFSVLDRRAAQQMSSFCLENDVRLLAYGTLGGGLISKRWLGKPEPAPGAIDDWSKMKYKRFVDALGGWSALQGILVALDRIAQRHDVSISNVASRWVLDHPAVAAVIIGARLGEREHRASNLATLSFSLDEKDRQELDDAFSQSVMLDGDCGDEYRKPPFLTASGDLSHHLQTMPKAYTATTQPGNERQQVSTGSIWETVCGFSRAVRVKDRILVSGTTATDGQGRVVCAGDPAGQAVYILDKIAASLSPLGSCLNDVVRTRIYLRHVSDWEAVSRVHGRYFSQIRPANTLIEVANLVGDYLVEIEAEAIV